MSESDASYNKIILEDLVHIYDRTGRHDLFMKYNAQLIRMYEEENQLLNEDYCDYTIQKYYNDKQKKLLQEKMLHARTSWVIIIASALLALAYMIMKIEYIKIMNRMDGLSRCYNRNYFDRLYQKKKLRHAHQVIMFDIDDFKKINDRYGHICGDDVIRELGEIVKRVVGSKGKVFRYGGEEFIVLTRMESLDQAYQMAEMIRIAVEKSSWKSADRVTISLGVADVSHTNEDLVKAADERMYHSKENGKNCTSM